MKIKNIHAIEILDSRGNPTLDTFITLDDGTTGSSSIPSGASTGSHEAVELRDHDTNRYGGLGVLNAVNNVNSVIAPKLVNMQPDQPDEIDRMIIELDGTPDKSHLGANAILSVSQALLKALSAAQKKPLWELINEIYFPGRNPSVPKLMFNVVNGGKHANWGFDIQEFIVIPSRQLASEALKVGSEIYHSIQKVLKNRHLTILVGDEGGFSPALNSNEEVFKLIIESAENIGYKNGKDYRLGIDAAASEFLLPEKKGFYIFKKEGRTLSSDELIGYYQSLKKKYNIQSFEDPFAEDDWESFKKFTAADPNSVVIGDDIYTTDTKLIKKGISEKTTNGVLIKPNQIGTVKETVEAIKSAKTNHWYIAVSHRSGETGDSFIADLAYAAGADFLKSGAPARSERLAKYNRLVEIENKF